MVEKWFTIEPPEIYLSCNCFDLKFHFIQHMLACGLVNNAIQLYQLTEDECTLQGEILSHTKSVRSLLYLDEQRLISTGSDCSIQITDITTLQQMYAIPFAHSAPINALALGPQYLASGDDDGEISLWDVRGNPQQTKVATFTDSAQQISALSFYANTLYAGDLNGHVYNYDVRTAKVVTGWELDHEVSDFVLVDNMIIAAGDQGNMTSLNLNLDQLEKFEGQTPINSLEATPVPGCILAGCEDGYVRLGSTSPLQLNTMLNMEDQLDYVGDTTSPIEKISMSTDGLLAASLSQECIVKFWDTSELQLQHETGFSGQFFENM